MSEFVNFAKKYVIERKYSNFIDASHWSRMARKITGSVVLEVVINSANRAKTQFSPLGLFCYVAWNALYIFCAYKAQSEDQTILRNLYSTKLNRYGDDFERISSFLYVLLSMWFLPFRISGSIQMMQMMLNIDKVIQDIGDNFDYTKYARMVSLITIGQTTVYIIRMLCIWFPINNTNESIPYEKMFQVVYSDAQAIILTSLYFYYNFNLRDRFKWINKVLKGIHTRSSWEYKVFLRSNLSPNVVKVVRMQDRHICEKIKSCARVYSMSFNLCGIINRRFGFALFITLSHYLNYIVLYLFYFMEATASGLFHDVDRYFNFLMYCFWEIAVAFGVIFLIIYFCESVMNEAKKTSNIVHDIINGDFSAEVNAEAMQLSVQLLHERPTFTVLGLIDLNYALLYSAARSVSTYLVVLLQFVTQDSDKSTNSKSK